MLSAFPESVRSCHEILRQRYLQVLIGSFVVFPAIYVLIPSLRKVLIRENNLLELLTVFCYAGVVIYGWRLCQGGIQVGMSKVYWTIPILGILGILEEESFGHSFLYFSVPKIYGVQLDSIHDVVRIGFVWMMDQEVSFQRVIGLAGVAIMVFLGWMLYWFWFEVKKFFLERPPFYYVLGCGGLLMVAALLDLEVFVMPGLQLLEELLEMLASVALLWSCFSLYCLLRGDSSGLRESEEG